MQRKIATLIDLIKFLGNFIKLYCSKEIIAPHFSRQECIGLNLTLVDDPYYYKLYDLIHNKLLHNNKNLPLPRYINVTSEFEPWLNARTRKFLTKLELTRVLEKQFKAGSVLTSNIVEECEIFRPALVEKYSEMLSKINSKKEFLNICIDGVRVGDLIYDSYLRFKPALTLDLKDEFLLRLLLNTDALVSKARKTFRQFKVTYLMTPYCSYIHWGVWVRVALDEGVDVYAVGNVNQFIKRVHSYFPSHVKGYDKYQDLIAHHPASQDIKKKIEDTIEKRLNGRALDDAIYYMSVNPFADLHESQKLNLKDHLVFMLHAFTDSPHVYRSMIFEDFYEWIIESAKFCEENNIEYAVKIHPSETEPELVKNTLRSRLRTVKILDKDISNKAISSSGIKAMVTIHGTICYEFAFLGIPVICAGDNPHVQFSFCYLPKSKALYFEALKYPPKHFGPQFKNEIIDFYYAHNIAMIDGRISSDSAAELMTYLTDKTQNSVSPRLLSESKVALDSLNIEERDKC